MNPWFKKKNGVIPFFHFPKLFFCILYINQQKNTKNWKTKETKKQTTQKPTTNQHQHHTRPQSSYTVKKETQKSVQ